MARSPWLLGTSGERDEATRIGIARIGVGSLAFLPTAVARRVVFLPREEVTPAATFFTRAFGIRNIVLGAWTLFQRDADTDTRRQWYTINAAVDGVDLALLGMFALSGKRAWPFSALGFFLGGSALLAWLDLLEGVGQPA